MSRKKIQGITIELDGDSSPLKKALGEIDKASGKTTKELSQINRALKFDEGNTTLLAQKFEVLQEAVQNTQRRFDALKQAQVEVERQFAAGEIDASSYREFIRELETTESKLNSLKSQMQSVQDYQDNFAANTRNLERLFSVTGTSIDDFADALGNNLVNAIKEGRASASQLDDAFNKIAKSAISAEADVNEVRKALSRLDSGSSIDEIRTELNRLGESANDASRNVEELGNQLGNLAMGIGAGLGLADVIGQSLNLSDLNAKIDVTFNVPESSKAFVKDTLKEVEAFGVDGEAALEGLRRQWSLNKDASDEMNASVVKGAAAISKAYAGIDFVELVQETNEIGKELGIADEEALNLVNDLLRINFPPEQLDIISEYGSQLRRAGYEAEQIKGIMASAVLTGTWNIDNLLDGLKEGRIRASEMGMGISDGMKDAVRQAVGNVKKASDEQINAMQESFSKQENALSRSLEKRYDAISKSHEKQKKEFSKALDADYDIAQKAYDKQYEAKAKSLEQEYEAVAETLEKQKSELDKALDAELRAFEKASNEKIALIDKEYIEKLKLIDEERYNQLKSIDAQIDALNARTEAEDKAIKQREDAEKRAELTRKIQTAKTNKERAEAQKALQDFEEKLRIEAIREQRKAQIDALKEQQDAVKEAADNQKDALKTEIDERKAKAKEQSDIEKQILIDRQQAEKEALAKSNAERLKAIKESNSAELSSLKELQANKLQTLREEQAERQELLNERLSNELSAVQEAHNAELASFKAMNDEKIELAKNPPDSAAVQAIFKQLEGWGVAIAKGGKEGTKAFEDMTRWLDSIDNATLKNALGVEIFGTMWEDQGDKIVQSILGAEEALRMFENGQIDAIELANQLGENSGLYQLKKAAGDLVIALGPLLNIIAEIIKAFAGWVSKNPEIAGMILALITTVGILVGGLAAIAPIVTAVTSVMGAAGVTFGALVTPIGWVVAAIGALIAIVAVLTKVWKPLTKFFKDLFSGIFNIFKSIIGAIVSFVSSSFKKVADLILSAFQSLPEKIREIFRAIASFIKAPINFIIEMVNKLIKGLNKLQVPDWVPVFGGKGINIPEIPMLAKGTDYFRGGYAIVGEEGPELVEMPTGAKVNTADKTANMLGGAQEIVIPVTLTVDGKVLARTTAKYNSREIYNHSKSQQRGGRSQ
ncbi:tape measure protein [Lysinibacillus sp. KU-BSD001]|uniref:tape measure protein n=1 Tax=Lysinibacillus sp. KU-BSD001 TaxID=3141328 RepID=UPI0036F01831